MSNNYKIFLLCFLCVFALVSAMGCTSAVKSEGRDWSKEVYWPKEPDPTRIRWINLVHSDLSVRDVSGSEKMFGMKPSFFLNKPVDVVVDKRGNAYVSEHVGNYIATFNLETKTAKKLNLTGVITPFGLAYNEKLDWLVVVSPISKSATVIQLPELTTKFIINDSNGTELKHPVDADIDAERGRIYITDSKDGHIHVYDLEGKFQHDIGTPGRGPTNLFSPTFMTLDKDGNIYVVETFSFRFHVFSPDGETLATVGEIGTYVGAFARPKGIALDQEGHIYVSDDAFGNIQVFDMQGNVYIFFGSVGRRPGQFDIPEGLFIDKKNRLFVADRNNGRVQIFQIYSDKYYEEHPEEAAKFENSAKTVIPEKTDSPASEGTTSTSEETTPEDVWEEPTVEDTPPAMEDNGSAGSEMEDAQPSPDELEMEESQPTMEDAQPSSDEVIETAPAEEAPSFDEEEMDTDQ